MHADTIDPSCQETRSLRLDFRNFLDSRFQWKDWRRYARQRGYIEMRVPAAGLLDVFEIVVWVKAHIGDDHYQYHATPYYLTFWFERERDAAMFALKWGS